jgi:hypothetical protein
MNNLNLGDVHGRRIQNPAAQPPLHSALAHLIGVKDIVWGRKSQLRVGLVVGVDPKPLDNFL